MTASCGSRMKSPKSPDSSMPVGPKMSLSSRLATMEKMKVKSTKNQYSLRRARPLKFT